MKANGGAWLRSGAPANACNGAIYLRKIDSEGAYGKKYLYFGKNSTDAVGPGWYEEAYSADGSTLIQGDAVTLKSGEGVIVYSSKSDAAAKFRVSGSVKLTPYSGDVMNGYQFGGNCTPAPLNLSAIQCVKANGGAWLRSGAPANACNGAIYLRKIDSEGAYGKKYLYFGKNSTDAVGPGWYEEAYSADGSTLIQGDAVSFAPGEGWIMYSSKTDKAAKVIIPSAVK